MTTFQVEFERVGRRRDIPPFVCTVNTIDEFEDAIHRYVRPHIRSLGLTVAVNMGRGNGFLAVGVAHCAGEFTFRIIDDPSGAS